MEKLAGWSVAKLIGQLFVVRTSGYQRDQDRLYSERDLSEADTLAAVTDYQVGGFLIFGGSVTESTVKIRELQRLSAVPLLICADLEEGAGQHFMGATCLPPAMALAQAGSAACYEAGLITADEALSVGINWVLEPLADVNSNPLNPVINVRAFGEQAAQVQTHSLAFLRGLQAGGVLSCAKHFPGHGDVDSDSHLALPQLMLSQDQLSEAHWPPFRALIAAGVSAVMAAHLQVPELDASDLPASLSPFVLTEILRKQWGFTGLIVTDALTMHAITDRYGAGQAAVRAVLAGADIILMPQDLPTAYAAMIEAVQIRQISRERLEASVTRILMAKAQIPVFTKSIDWLTHRQRSHELYAQGLRLQLHSALPSLQADPNRWKNVLVFSPKSPLAPLITQLHPQSYVLADNTQEFPALGSAEWVLVHLLLATGPYHSYTCLSQALENFLQALSTRTRVVVVSYGNPYLLQNLASTIERIYAYSPRQQAQQAVVDLFS